MPPRNRDPRWRKYLAEHLGEIPPPGAKGTSAARARAAWFTMLWHRWRRLAEAGMLAEGAPGQPGGGGKPKPAKEG